MSKASVLLPLNLSAPGAAGLTDQTSIAGDVEEWLFEAHNVVYNSEGLLSPRRLWRTPDPAYVSGSFPGYTSTNFLYPTFAADQYFVGDTAEIWTSNGVGLTTLADDGDVPVAWVTTVNWKVVYLNAKWYFFAQGQEAKVYDPFAFGGEFSGVPAAPEYGVVHSAFGRLWVASMSATDKKLYWSLLLNGKDWTSAGTGDLDLSTYLSEGEVVTAIADFNGYLIVFTNDSILIFQDPFTVPVDTDGAAGTTATMSLKEKIDGTGCIGVNAWCSIGEEILFLSHAGLKSLGRVLSDGGANPLDVVSPQVSESIIKAYKDSVGTSQNLHWMRLNYHPSLGFVTLENGLSYENAVYLIWVNRPLEKGVYSVTKWGKLRSEVNTGDSSVIYYQGLYPTGGFANVGPGITAILKIHNSAGTVIYHGLAHYGMMGTLSTEEVLEERFTFRVRSAWLTFGDQASPTVKIPKDLKLIYRTPQAPYAEGHAYTPSALDVTFNLRFDYSTVARGHSFTTPLIQAGEFDVSVDKSEHTITPIPLAGNGSLVQWEIEAVVDNRAHESFAIQRAGFQTKLGRIHQGI